MSPMFRNFLVFLLLLCTASVAAAQELDNGDEYIMGNFNLSEVIIQGNAFGGRYSRKNNPGLDIVREIIANKDSYRPNLNGCISRSRHDILTLSLSEADHGALKKLLKLRPELFIRYLDLYPSPEPLLNLTARESTATEYFDASPEGRAVVYDKRFRSGVDDFLTEDEVENIQKELIGSVDIFDPNIKLLDERFISPLSAFGTIAYRFALRKDTVFIGKDRCVDIVFAPVDPTACTFTGHLYVDASSHALRHIQMTTSPEAKINFLKSILIIQSFSPDSAGHNSKSYELTLANFSVRQAGGAAIRKETAYAGYRYVGAEGSEEQPTASVSPTASFGALPSDSYKLTEGLIRELRQYPFYNMLEGIASIIDYNFLPSSPEGPAFFFGPVTSTLSFNNIEGLRLRAGGMTSGYLNPHLGARFYVAYGTKDRKWKYMGQLEYSFNPRQRHFGEYPVHSLRLRCDYDIFPLREWKPDEGWDNLFESIKHTYSYPYAMQRRQELSYNSELQGGFSYSLKARHRTFLEPDDPRFPSSLMPQGMTDFDLSEMEIALRYSPGEVFLDKPDARYVMRREAPIFSLRHTMAHKGLLGSDYDYMHTEFSYKQRIRFGAYGFSDNTVKAGRVWTPNVPIPLLIVPNSSPAFKLNDISYADFNPMDLVSDRYVQWNFTNKMRGIVFNHIPLLKKLDLREIVGAKNIWMPNSTYRRLENSHIPATADPNALCPLPCTKITLGVGNIFHCMEIDYVWQATWREIFGSSNDGIQVQLKLRL